MGNATTMDKEHKYSTYNEKENSESIESNNNADRDSSFSMENLPLFGRILITDDGTDQQNNVLQYAVSISKYTGAELIILRVVKDIKQIESVAVEDSAVSDEQTKREAKRGVVDEMEEKIKRCKESGFQNNISYKFRVGDTIEQIINEIKEGYYDLLILRSVHLDSWMTSLFSNARKIISRINVPVLIVH